MDSGYPQQEQLSSELPPLPTEDRPASSDGHEPAADAGQTGAAVPDARRGTGVSLHVKNLANQLTDTDIKQIFEAAGEVLDVYVPQFHRTRERKEFAFVEMATAEAAEKAIREVHGQVVYGRTLEVMLAKGSRKDSKQMRAEDLKAKSGREPPRGGDARDHRRDYGRGGRGRDGADRYPPRYERRRRSRSRDRRPPPRRSRSPDNRGYYGDHHRSYHHHHHHRGDSSSRGRRGASPSPRPSYDEHAPAPYPPHNGGGGESAPPPVPASSSTSRGRSREPRPQHQHSHHRRGRSASR